MKQYLLYFVGIILAVNAQFPVIPDVPGVEKKWTGPIADHVIGQLVEDTPEVALAKQQHYRAVQEAEASLPKLPPEVRYQKTGLPLAAQLQAQAQLVHHPIVVPLAVQPVITHPGVIPQIHSEIRVFAEEIPRSEIGEVPEVHAARQAHLAAVRAVQSQLPQIVEERTTERQAQFLSAVAPQVHGNYLADTPEVAAAREAHARALKQLGF